MTNEEEIMKNQIEDLMLERDTLLDVIRSFKQDLHNMTVNRDHWRHEHKLLAIDKGFSRDQYEEYLKTHHIDGR